MKVEQPFNHTELPTDWLQERLKAVVEHGNTVPLGKERIEQLGHELACLVFELDMREKEA